ncbi:protein phosphatase 2C domain-containing protein [Streptomyces sp. SL13]|uniref:Serine/threonine protein phosphatase PstP n=1 Tax=Streptantibioticus silvisoli TaxID=2705255 RepID=A0AA90K989_9ACTN|nr:PP2C family serine/threonine-protein phosphatase [Streptantibioticus silvisoli]MDI5964311.1 protein phosphatase 2C domain-containing protein [Streptantibioticus silvisoli]MDI5970587.1 protein phosphatase 2C domain-containing protein [Streptantibioticus silvisoli]
MSLSLRFAAGSHKGMIREGNEDSGYAGPRLLAIADGMGGQAAGEVASSEVISTLVVLDDDVPGSDILTSLGDAVQRANDQLRDMVEEDPQLEGMGTTLTALLWTGQRLGLVHIGDSRGYLLRDGALSQITQDHTWVQRLVDEGRITEEEAGTHPQRSLLMRALDGRGQVEPDLSIREVRAGDRYMICSDGLSGVVSDQTLEETLAGYQGPYETVQELIQLALRGGGPDNITCIVADVFDTEDGGGAAGMHNEHPVVVGAVAEHPHAMADQRHLQTPAGRAAELGRPQQPAPQPPEGAFGPPDSGHQPAGATPLGSFGPPGEGGHAKPRPRRRWLRRTGASVVVLAVVGGGLYAGYRWTQTQFYVGANGDHVAVYQGISQSLLGLSLSQVHQDHPEIELKYLPTYQRDEVKNTIAVTSLSQATSKTVELGNQASVCKIVASAKSKPGTSGASGAAAGTPGGKASAKPSGKPSTSPSNTPHTDAASSAKPKSTPSPGPTLSADQQKLAQQCGSGQQ